MSHPKYAIPVGLCTLAWCALTQINSAFADTPAVPAATAPTTIGVDEAVQIGLANNPQVGASVFARDAARGTYKSQAAVPNVNLTVDSVNGTSSAPTLNGNTHDLYTDFGETLDTSRQHHYGTANAKALYDASKATLSQTQLGLAQEIRDAYWSLVAARAQTQFAQDSQNDVQTVNNATRAQNAAGAAPRGDVLRSNIDLANAKQATITAAAAEATALNAFNVLLARSPDTPENLADDFLTAAAGTGAAPQPVPQLAPVSELTRRAIAASPAVRAALDQVQAAGYTTRQAESSRFPDLSVDYEKSLEDPTHSVVIALHVPLFDFGSIKETVRSARASRDEAAQQAVQAEATVQGQVQQGYLDYTSAQAQAASYQTDILAPSQTLLDMAQLGYKQGATGILPVLDAESTLRSARTGYIAALLAVYKAQDELLAATADSGVAGTKPYVAR